MGAEQSLFSGIDRSDHAWSGSLQYRTPRPVPFSEWLRISFLICVLLAFGIWIQQEVSRRLDGARVTRQQLAALPQAVVLKPALFGHHHLAADLLWLQSVQVLGEREVDEAEYEWLFHAFDLITTLDPRFVAAYDTGGLLLTELARRVDLSNQLLEKGMAANPTAWRIPYLLGFNHFFYQRDYGVAAQYLAAASHLPGRPNYVPELASRLYVEAHSPELALSFLNSILDQTGDPQVVTVLGRRRGEVRIEMDIDMLEAAMARYRQRFGQQPAALTQLVDEKVLASLPREPFGGDYQLDPKSGHVVSTTHPQRMKLFHPDEALPRRSGSDEP